MSDLILALDLTDAKKAVDLAKKTAPFLDAIKVGYPLILAAGLAVVDDLLACGLPIIADFKVADIPNTNYLIAEQVFKSGIFGIICHGFTGSDSITACVDVAHDAGGECYVVCEMSHLGAEEFFHHGTAERIAALATGCGADGIIAPATRPERTQMLREIIGSKKILSPGVGAQGGDAASISAFVDGIIIGRGIYEAEDPKAAAARYAMACR